MSQSQRFTTGVREFDTRFASCASDATQGIRILKDPSLAKAILAMPRGTDDRVHDGRCHVCVDGHPHDVAFVDRLIESSANSEWIGLSVAIPILRKRMRANRFLRALRDGSK
jgi:hypothetical protein